MNSQGYGIVCRSVGMVCKVKRVQSVRKGRADVCSDYPLEALHDDFFGTGTMVVFLKQVPSTDWYRERLNIGVSPNIDLRDDIDALGDVDCDGVCVFINVPVRCNTEHLLVCGFKTVP